MDKTWSDKIRALEKAGWSQAALSEAIGITPQSISDIKNGRTKAPTGMAAVRLHDLYSTRARPAAAA